MGHTGQTAGLMGHPAKSHCHTHTDEDCQIQQGMKTVLTTPSVLPHELFVPTRGAVDSVRVILKARTIV